MSKFRTIFFTFFAVGVLLSLSSATAKAQVMANPTQQDTDRARSTGPCSDPWVSIALTLHRLGTYYTSTTPGFIHGSGNTGDCQTTLYYKGGVGWNSFDQLYQAVVGVRSYEKKMNDQGIVLAGSITGKDGHQILIFKNGSAVIGVDVGVISNDGGSLISNDGTTLTLRGGNLVASGGGNFISAAAIVAAGGGNILVNGGGNILLNGGGNILVNGGGSFRQGPNNHYGVLADGETLFQFPNRYALVPKPQASPPPNPGVSSGRSDESILLCINSQGSALRQIRGADRGANHISLGVSSGNAYFSGNVLSQSYKDQLINAAKSCGAPSVDTNRLRVGR
jgi:hypothetical protein